MTNDPVHDLLSELTPSAVKADAYTGDTYVLETVDQLDRIGCDAAKFAREHALLLLKPDAVVARAIEPTLEWLRGNGFRVVAARRTVVDRHLARALWYFAWNIASPERRRLADLLVRISDVLVLVIHGPDGELPVQARLTAAKGPTDPSKRKPGELRHLVGKDNYLLNLVHTPDDPADVLRELAIYFDERERAAVLREVCAGQDRTDAATALAHTLYSEVPARSFDREDAVDALRETLAGAVTDAERARALDAALSSGREIDAWSAIVLGSYVFPMRVGTQTQLLRPVTANDWLEGRS
ncbi:nucleoside-diphosphate kinase [Nocardia huaxiensis]|uniref:Nucleoside-diphosphate kinase n=1 Tax=Nocardia huaxiensis TaxID=2755382 RepID=A0A7D6VEQ2_9NOCA|nr:nucleoside-diphosphate kinase [Nocardia huaxiensis]QLY33313.1 nucleoside-diphosphate kinase [Nocardia huaxiensis]UFS99784.1 nucleoside-diphosphate kinase [Nocardia huaxiensis]